MSAEMTTPAEASRARHSRIGLGYIFIAVVSYAFIPTVIGHIGGEALPFYFMGAWRAGVAVGCVAILIPLYVPLVQQIQLGQIQVSPVHLRDKGN